MDAKVLMDGMVKFNEKKKFRKERCGFRNKRRNADQNILERKLHENMKAKKI